MGVNMEDRLPSGFTGIEDQPELGEAEVGRHGCCISQQPACELGIAGSYRGDITVVGARDDQDVCGRLWRDVTKGQGVVRRPDYIGGDFSSHDLAEQTVSVGRHECSPRVEPRAYGPRSARWRGPAWLPPPPQ